MAVHIGKIIHDLILQKGVKAHTVAAAISISDSSLYKIYKRKTIDIDKLIRFSQFLEVNLFQYYFEQEPLKSMLNPHADNLNTEITTLRNLLEERTQRMRDLERLTAAQEKILAMMETIRDRDKPAD